VSQLKKEVFVPIYLSNICHGACKICNMRRDNAEMLRITGTPKQFEEQLHVLYNIENIREICLLTGEYVEGKERSDNFFFVLYCIARAFEYGFEKVFFNIGSLTNYEIDLIFEKFPNDERLVLSLFQESYDKKLYEDFFGSPDKNNPKSNFQQRLSTPQRWIEKGFKNVDIGILLGLTKTIDKDVQHLIEHARKLYEMGATVYISLPRMYRFGQMNTLVSEDEFVRLVKFIKNECDWAKVIITTRESTEMIKKLLDYVDVISPGSSDVMPYSRKGSISNNIETSQFQVEPFRKRPREILTELAVDMTANDIYCKYERKLNLFLGGPIQHISNNELLIDEDKQLLIQSLIDALCLGSINVFSAHVEEQYGMRIPTVKEVCIRDFAWMENCDVFCLLVLDNGKNIIRSDGSFIELGWASSMNKPTIVIIDPVMLENTSFLFQGLISKFNIRVISLEKVISSPLILVDEINSMIANFKG
jgi:nucleoside 2-deoxyribosyltransferase